MRLSSLIADVKPRRSDDTRILRGGILEINGSSSFPLFYKYSTVSQVLFSQLQSDTNVPPVCVCVGGWACMCVCLGSAASLEDEWGLISALSEVIHIKQVPEEGGGQTRE